MPKKPRFVFEWEWPRFYLAWLWKMWPGRTYGKIGNVAWTVAVVVAVAIRAFGIWFDDGVPERWQDTVNELTWQIPLGMVVAVLVWRGMAAPYWLYKDVKNERLRPRKPTVEFDGYIAIEADPDRMMAIELTSRVWNKGDLDATRCRLRLDSAMLSTGQTLNIRDRPLAWVSGQEEETISPQVPALFEIVRSYVPPTPISAGRVMEFTFSAGRSVSFEDIGVQLGHVVWISIELSQSDAPPSFGVFRIHSGQLFIAQDNPKVQPDDVIQLKYQSTERPDIAELIKESGFDVSQETSQLITEN